MNLRKSLAKKLKKTGGFTLIEMLVVVAIIAILVAVSIPMVGASLNKAKTATDDANFRAAKAAALIAYMLEDPTPTASKDYHYNATTGEAQSSPSGITAYGQGDGKTNQYVKVTVDTTGKATPVWTDVSGG